MSFASRSVKASLCAAAFLLLAVATAIGAQNKDADTKAAADSGAQDARLTIVVTGGDEKKPVDSASVYVRFVEEHKHGKDKKIEMNLKTNQSGVYPAHLYRDTFKEEKD